MKTSRILVLVLFLAQCMISPIDNMDSRTLGGSLYRLFPFLLPKKSSTPPSVIATNAIVGEEKFAINRKVYAIFNKEIRLISDSALAVYTGRNKISGKVSIEKNTIKFTPDSFFPKDAKLTATIYKNGVVDFDSNSMESDFSFSFETGSQSDLTPPLISSISPLNGASSVGTNTEIAIEFSEAMEVSTLTNENIELYEGSEKIPVTINYAGNTVLLKPSRTLAASSNYVINVKKAVQDSAGNSMSADFTSTFTTGGGIDSTLPMVSAVFPSNGSVDIPTTQKGIILIFSEVLDPLSITKNSIQIQNSLSETVSGSFVRIANTVVFYSSSNYEANLTYTIKVNKEIKDLAGNALDKDYTFTFSTVTYLSAGSLPPSTFTLSSTSSNLTNGQTNVSPSGNISFTFPEPIDPASVNGSNLILVDSAGNVISGTFSFTNNNMTVVFDPSIELATNTTYSVSLLDGVKTLSGKRLSSTFTLSFTTGAISVLQYTIGGTVSGLVGSVSLQNNSTDTLTLTANGNFTFATALNSGSSYGVSVLTQPASQTCSVSNGSGILASNIPNVAVTCVNNPVTTPPSALTYSANTYTFTNGTTITTSTPTVTGTITSCTVTPALPTGLSLNATTCAISGTPTVNQSATTYTITASNSGGSTTANITIQVIAVQSNSYPWGTFTDMGNGTIRFVGVAGTFGGQTYLADTLYFAKCSKDQVWDSVNNTCTGTVGQARYCLSANNSCNDSTTLTLNGTGTSQAWDYCNSLSLAGRSWRVPTKNELKLTILCSNSTILSSDNGSSCASSPAINTTLFPNTATCRYWTATASSSTDAWFINYCTGVAISNNNKDAFNYIRCVSTGP